MSHEIFEQEVHEDLLGFIMKATHPEHHVKVQVSFRCCTQDPCNWVREGERGRGTKEETKYLDK
jgi:hypothetical protein